MSKDVRLDSMPDELDKKSLIEDVASIDVFIELLIADSAVMPESLIEKPALGMSMPESYIES